MTESRLGILTKKRSSVCTSELVGRKPSKLGKWKSIKWSELSEDHILKQQQRAYLELIAKRLSIRKLDDWNRVDIEEIERCSPVRGLFTRHYKGFRML